MKVSTEKIPDAQLVMTIEVEPERLEEARGKALRKLAPRAKVPGFRPGKAPEPMLRRYLGEERILDEALDALVPAIYREAVEADESIDPIARAQLVVETTTPLVVKATIPLRPTVELGDYNAVRVLTEPVVVDEKRIDDTIETLRHRVATLEPIERDLQWGDVARLDVNGAVDGEPMVNAEDVEVQLSEEHDVLFPGFEEELIGHKKGESVEFDLGVPETVKEEKFAGKQCHFTVAIKETKEEVLPDLNDDFAKQVGEGFETVDVLRDRIREDIEKHEQEQLHNRYHDEILAELVDRAKIEFPPVMLEAEVDRMIHDQAQQIERGQGIESYLAALDKTEEEVRAEFKPIADARLRRSLILTEVAEAEHLDVTDEEVEAEIDRITASAGAQGQQLRQLFTRDEGQRTISRNLLTRKTLARLVEIATQDGEAATPTAEQETPKPAAKPAKKRKVQKQTPGAEAPAVTAEDSTDA